MLVGFQQGLQCCKPKGKFPNDMHTPLALCTVNLKITENLRLLMLEAGNHRTTVSVLATC